MRAVAVLASIGVMLSLCILRLDAATPTRKPVDYLTQALTAIGSVDNYTATFCTQDKESSPEETIQFKFKKPFAVYMKWIKNPNKGREVLYVKGKYGSKIIAHDGGLFGFVTVSINPGSKQAQGSGGDSINDIGIERFLETTLADIRKAESAKKLLSYSAGKDTLFGRAVEKVEFRYPSANGSQVRMIISFDSENGLPIQWVSYDSKGRMTGRSAYRDLRLNPGLDDNDFDRKNKAYRFR